MQMAPITIPVLIAGLISCVLLELSGMFGFGAKLPKLAKAIIEGFLVDEDNKRSKEERYALVIQAISAVYFNCCISFSSCPCRPNRFDHHCTTNCFNRYHG